MTTQSISPPIPSQAFRRTVRLLLATAAVLVLATAAFVLGRVTVNSGSTASNVPAPSTQSPVSSDLGVCQHYGHFYSAAC